MFKYIIIAVLLGLTAADHIDKNAETRSYTNDIGHEGNFHYEFDTSNGISVQQSGNGAYSVTGSAQWVAPDGTPVQFSYVADENGYQPEGSHLPTPPPVPDHVIRALEWIRAHPPREEHFQPQQKHF